MSKAKDLCDHITLSLGEDGALEVDGVGVPFFGWDPKTQADVPMLKCSRCDRKVRIIGKIVRRVDIR